MEKIRYSGIYRAMHWAIAFCLLFLLLTIFLRLTWMNREHIADIIQTYLSTTNHSLSSEEANTLARQIRKPMWDWHLYVGYALTGLFFLRLVLPLFGIMKFPNPFNQQLSLKVKFQYWVYLIFHVGVTTSLVTGLIIEFGPKDIKNLMEEIHILSIYYLVPFVFIHFAGVLYAEFTSQQGIISAIISGKTTTKD